MSISLTVIIPAYNEQENLPQALIDIERALQGLVSDYEILVIDDGSRDKTAQIAREKAGKDRRFKCLSNERNRGYGFSYMRGVKASTKKFIGVYSGDNELHWESFRELVKNMGKADVILQYPDNAHVRPLFRQFLSKTFTLMMNALFGLKLKYYNGCSICPRETLQRLDIRSQGLTVHAECYVKLIKQGCSYVEIPFTHMPRRGGRSTALSLKSIKATLAAVVLLYRDVYWKK